MQTNTLAAKLQADRGVFMATLDDIVAKAEAEQRALNDEEIQAFDDTKAKIETLDKSITRLEEREAQAAVTAKPVAVLDTGDGLGHISGGVAPKLEPGQKFARAAIALARHRFDRQAAAQYADRRWGNTPDVGKWILGAAVDVGTTTDADWAAPLVHKTDLVSEFIEFLRPATVLGQIQGLRRLSFNGAGAFKIPRQIGGATGYWVGETKPKPATKLSFDSIEISPLKCAAICAFSDELLRRSDPNVEILVRDDLVKGIAQVQDVQFIDPGAVVVPGISPTPITVAPGHTAASAGNTVANITADLSGAMQGLEDANIIADAPVWIMAPRNRRYLMLQRTAQDLWAWRDELLRGTLLGIPVIVSKNVPASLIVLADAAELVTADDGGVQIDSSNEATIQLDTAPTDPPTNMVSLWQQNMTAIRVEQIITWFRRRAEAVATITGVAW